MHREAIHDALPTKPPRDLSALRDRAANVRARSAELGARALAARALSIEMRAEIGERRAARQSSLGTAATAALLAAFAELDDAARASSADCSAAPTDADFERAFLAAMDTMVRRLDDTDRDALGDRLRALGDALGIGRPAPREPRASRFRPPLRS